MAAISAPIVGALRQLLVQSSAARARNRGCWLATCGATAGCGASGCVVATCVVAVVSSLLPVHVATPSAACVAGSGCSQRWTAPLRCAGVRASQGFGTTPWEHPHTGIDLVCPPGTPVYATADGIFHRRSGADIACAFPAGARGGLGLYGELDVPGVVILFGHLEAFSAADDSRVAAGQALGFEGDTGCSSGFHLHYEADVGRRPVNPCAYLPTGYPSVRSGDAWRCWGDVPP